MESKTQQIHPSTTLQLWRGKKVRHRSSCRKGSWSNGSGTVFPWEGVPAAYDSYAVSGVASAATNAVVTHYSWLTWRPPRKWKVSPYLSRMYIQKYQSSKVTYYILTRCFQRVTNGQPYPIGLQTGHPLEVGSSCSKLPGVFSTDGLSPCPALWVLCRDARSGVPGVRPKACHVFRGVT